MSDNSTHIGFVDTNIWLYAFVASEDRGKHEAAKEFIRRCQAVISTQVINEVCVNLLSKTQSTESDIGRLIASFYDEYEVVALNRSILENASKLRARHSLSFWDSIIVSSALYANTPVLYSEDMQDGPVIEDRLQIRNPL